MSATGHNALYDSARYTQFPHPFDVVAIGTSAGGLDALGQILSNLPIEFPLPISVVQCRSPHCKADVLPLCLKRLSCLPVRNARGGAQIAPSQVYVAPPDQHLPIDNRGALSLANTYKMMFFQTGNKSPLLQRRQCLSGVR